MIKTIMPLLVIIIMGIGSYAYADTLCPDPKVESSVVPSDLAQVQEDIDRLTLCVERTQLLQRLNDLATQSASAAGYLQPLDAGSLNPNFLNGQQANKGSNPRIVAPNTKTQPFINQDQWSIRKVWGQSGELYAQLVSNSGVMSTVKEGETLSDETVVTDISSRGVTVTKNDGTVQPLQWQEVIDETL